jgi:hypothetical protein
MKDKEFEELKDGLTPEKACKVIGSLIEKLKEPENMKILKIAHDGDVSIDRFYEDTRKRVYNLVEFGILKKDVTRSYQSNSITYSLSEFTKELLGLREE